MRLDGGLVCLPFVPGGAWCVIRTVVGIHSKQQGQSYFGISVSSGVTHNSKKFDMRSM